MYISVTHGITNRASKSLKIVKYLVMKYRIVYRCYELQLENYLYINIYY